MVTFSIPNITCGGLTKGVLVAPGVAPTADLDQREVRMDAARIAPLIAALRAGGRNAALHG
ncbi:MAG: hypothetical protein K2X74_02180 [Acetobacteraceae bacterium]|nr:hypothetical protein [Acetobacteraceae bacterium]MBY0362015.1 hypothetical protein [Phreatobacter sp.]